MAHPFRISELPAWVNWRKAGVVVRFAVAALYERRNLLYGPFLRQGRLRPPLQQTETPPKPEGGTAAQHLPGFITKLKRSLGLPEGRGFTGCGRTLQYCHPERSEGSRSEYFQGNARFFVAAAPQNDSAFEFFRSLFSPAEIAFPALCPSRTPRNLQPQAAKGAGHGNNQKGPLTAWLKPRPSEIVVRNAD